MSNTNKQTMIQFSLDTASGVPFYRQIIQQIESAVLSGTLKKGTKLPTIRSLAIELKINPNTIAKAYSELELKGVLVTQVGSGTYVSEEKADIDENERTKIIAALLVRFIREFETIGVTADKIPELLEKHLKEQS